jgi:hypothetical protein
MFREFPLNALIKPIKLEGNRIHRASKKWPTREGQARNPSFMNPLKENPPTTTLVLLNLRKIL